MGLISSFTIIRAISLAHLMAVYFLLTNPQVLADNNLVVILGEAMQVPHPTTIPTRPTELSALTALLLLFIALSDLAATSLPTRSSLEYYSAIVPLRLIVFFGLTIYIYLFSADLSSFYDADAVLATLKGVGQGGLGLGHGVGKGGGGALELLMNSLVFSTAFVESCSWFWVYTLLRDERRAFVLELAIEEARREEEEKERLMFGR